MHDVRISLWRRRDISGDSASSVISRDMGADTGTSGDVGTPLETWGQTPWTLIVRDFMVIGNAKSSGTDKCSPKLTPFRQARGKMWIES